jgi:hypothetical protein
MEFIDYLVQYGGDNAATQQTLNMLQDRYMRLGMDRRRAQAVQEDSLEHGLSESPPWPLQEGSRVRDAILNQGSLATQRHVLEYCKGKSKGKHSKNTSTGTGKGKGPARDVQAPETAQTATSATPPTSSATSGPSSRASAATSTAPPPRANTTPSPPWRRQPSPSRGNASEAAEANSAMEDEDGPERGSKRPATSSPPEATQNQDEEDEFQEAARYRRGDGHLC